MVLTVDVDANCLSVSMQLDFMPLIIVQRRSLRPQVNVFESSVDNNHRLAFNQLKVGYNRVVADIKDNSVGL